MQQLADRLLNDASKARKFEFNKMGVDLNDSVQMEDGLEAFKTLWQLLCDSSTVENAFDSQADFVISYCYMTENRLKSELSECVSRM